MCQSEEVSRIVPIAHWTLAGNSVTHILFMNVRCPIFIDALNLVPTQGILLDFVSQFGWEAEERRLLLVEQNTMQYISIEGCRKACSFTMLLYVSLPCLVLDHVKCYIGVASWVLG
jgi:hypothetical protein